MDDTYSIGRGGWEGRDGHCCSLCGRETSGVFGGWAKGDGG